MKKLIEKIKQKINRGGGYYGRYTILFLLIASFIMFIFFRCKKGFIWGVDGFYQHNFLLRYFHNLLLNFFKTGHFNTFTWRIGTGLDMYANLAYYILGDFFAYFNIFVPENKLYLFYYFMLLVRNYCVGLSFLYYCKQKKYKCFESTMGALIYTFCGWQLYTGIRHPYFPNALILFPLLMLGMEKIVKENKKTFYVIIVAITAACNFYFAYFMCLIAGIYCLFLTIDTYKKEKWQFKIKKILTVILYSLIGVLLSSWVLLPTIYAFFSSSRVGTQIYPYSIDYYRNLPNDLFSHAGGYSLRINSHAIVLISLPYFLIHRKENKPIYHLFLFLLFPLLISNVSSMLMGFSWPNNRWCFILVFIFALTAVKLLNNKIPLTKKEKNFIVIFDIIYLILMFISQITINPLYLFSLILLAILLYIFFTTKDFNHKKYKIIITILIVVGLSYSAYYYYDPNGLNYSQEFKNFNSVNYLINTNQENNPDLDNILKYINKKEGEDYYRILFENTTLNLALAKPFNTIPFYYSLSPKEIYELNYDIRNKDIYVSQYYNRIDFRTKILTLLNNRYYISKTGKNVPYGYELEKNYKGQSKVYKNKYAIPLVSFYDKVIKSENYENLNPLEKETSLLRQAVLDEDKYKEGTTNFNDDIKYYDYGSKSLEITNTSKNKITLNVQEPLKGEVYVFIKNIQYKPYTKQEMIDFKVNELLASNSNSNINKANEIAKIKHNYRFYDPAYDYKITLKSKNVNITYGVTNFKTDNYYLDRSTMVINLGYFDEFKDNIDITFSKVGFYSYDSIQIATVLMDNYEDDVENLRKSNFKITKYADNLMEGSINLPNDGIIQIQTPYSKGWDIYIDDQKVKSQKVNKYFLGAQVEKGYHQIKIIYHTPYLKLGITISLFTGLFLSVIILFKKKKKREVNYDPKNEKSN